MPRIELHRVIPEGVQNGPREVIAVVFADSVGGRARNRYRLAKEHAAPLVFYNEYGHQHKYDRGLRGHLGHILRQPVVPDVRLHQMHQNKESIRGERRDVEPVQISAVFGVAVSGLPDQVPDDELV